jgi:hypothetical protein
MRTKRIEVTLGFMVPEWVMYIAQDHDGDWFGWEKKPEKNHVNNRWFNGGEMTHIASGHENSTWWKTLRKVA